RTVPGVKVKPPFCATTTSIVIGPTHTPARHISLLLQALPQAPQFLASAVVSASHPSTGSLLQSPNPALQLSVHRPAPQAAAALAPAGHTLAQSPQFVGSFCRSTSQPSPGLLLQSRNPAMHPPTMQALLTQLTS